MQEKKKSLTPEAKRALEEVEVRRKKASLEDAQKEASWEVGGRDGPEPTRYGDWEKDGIVSDF